MGFLGAACWTAKSSDYGMSMSREQSEKMVGGGRQYCSASRLPVEYDCGDSALQLMAREICDRNKCTG